MFIQTRRLEFEKRLAPRPELSVHPRPGCQLYIWPPAAAAKCAAVEHPQQFGMLNPGTQKHYKALARICKLEVWHKNIKDNSLMNLSLCLIMVNQIPEPKKIRTWRLSCGVSSVNHKGSCFARCFGVVPSIPGTVYISKVCGSKILFLKPKPATWSRHVTTGSPTGNSREMTRLCLSVLGSGGTSDVDTVLWSWSWQR